MKTAAISGLHIRYDVKTKCNIVADIFSKVFKSKNHINSYIEKIATEYNISSATVKLWCIKYATTYKQGIKLPAGVMSVNFNPIKDYEINIAHKNLQQIQNNLEVLKQMYHPYIKTTSSSLLEKLIIKGK